MYKVVVSFLLFGVSLFGFSGSKIDNKFVTISILQNGQIVPIKDSTVSLKSVPFRFKFLMKDITSVRVHASFGNIIFNKVRSGLSLDKISLFGYGNAFADHMFNKDKSMILSNEGYNIWFYSGDDNHRFDEINKQSKGITAYRTIKKLFYQQKYWNIAAFTGKPLYLVICAYKRDRSSNELEEYFRYCLRINLQ